MDEEEAEDAAAPTAETPKEPAAKKHAGERTADPPLQQSVETVASSSTETGAATSLQSAVATEPGNAIAMVQTTQTKAQTATAAPSLQPAAATETENANVMQQTTQTTQQTTAAEAAMDADAGATKRRLHETSDVTEQHDLCKPSHSPVHCFPSYKRVFQKTAFISGVTAVRVWKINLH